MYYKQSGRYSPGGLLLGVAIGTAASAISAFAYGRGLILISEAHFAAFATIAFGAAIGGASGYGMVLGSVRNEKATIVASGVVAAIALYLSWAVWVVATVQGQHESSDVTWIQLALHPDVLWRSICYINQYGTWALDNSPSAPATHGAELWAIWIAEAAIVIGVAPFVAISVLRHRPFCEACGCWAERGARIYREAPVNMAQLKRHLETVDLQPLESLGPSNKENNLTITLNSCPRCRLFHTLSMTHTTITRTKLGKPVAKNNEIMRHLIVRPEHSETLRQLSAKGNSGTGVSKTNSAAVGKS